MCVKAIEDAFNKVDGVKEVNVNLASEKVSLSLLLKRYIPPAAKNLEIS